MGAAHLEVLTGKIIPRPCNLSNSASINLRMKGTVDPHALHARAVTTIEATEASVKILTIDKSTVQNFFGAHVRTPLASVFNIS